jgi:hypothetical protein
VLHMPIAEPPSLVPSARSPAPHTAVDQLVLTIKGAPVGATATEGAVTAEVALPEISSTEVAGAGAPVITCTGAFDGTLGYKAGITAVFPVDTTEVTCTAKDAAGHVSPPASFKVMACASGFAFTSGSCAGERLGPSWG